MKSASVMNATAPAHRSKHAPTAAMNAEIPQSDAFLFGELFSM